MTCSMLSAILCFGLGSVRPLWFIMMIRLGYAYFMRDHTGELIYAHADTHTHADSLQSEANAILQAAKHCRNT